MKLNNESRRNGAIAPMVALMLPIVFIMAGFAINIAYMQLISTETKIAADVCAHAGGRAMSEEQDTAAAIQTVKAIGAMNSIGGKPVTFTDSDADNDIEFGLSTRQGYSRYDFTGHALDDVNSKTKKANSISVQPFVDTPVVFASIPGATTSVNTTRRSIATQVDRDIALVLDRSGSMLFFEDETALTEAINTLYDTWIEVETEGEEEEGYYTYDWYKKKKNGYLKRYQGHGTIAEAATKNNWNYKHNASKVWHEGGTGEPQTESVRAISENEKNDALEWLYDRRYSSNVIDQLATIDQSMSDYAQGWEDMMNSASNWDNRTPAPPYSRWAFLVDGVEKFLQVLESTDQEEQVTLITFNSSVYFNHGLQKNFTTTRSKVAAITPYSGTQMGDGMLRGQTELKNGRLFAAKTIVLLTDGEWSGARDPDEEKEDGEGDWVEPESAATGIVAEDPITIHTVVFATDNEDAKTAMENVAENGYGRAYFAETGPELVGVFEEIANNLPTILTE